jgi:hypothetical protein
MPPAGGITIDQGQVPRSVQHQLGGAAARACAARIADRGGDKIGLTAGGGEGDRGAIAERHATRAGDVEPGCGQVDAATEGQGRRAEAVERQVGGKVGPGLHQQPGGA